MTGVDKDLATLRDWIGDPEDYSDEDRGAAERACDACDGVEAELSRLREQRDALRADYGDALKEVDELLDLMDAGREHIEPHDPIAPFLSAGWQCPVCDRRGNLHDERCLVLEIAAVARRRKNGNRRLVVTNGRLRARAEAAEARCARLQQALAGLESAVRILDVMLREPAAEGLMSAEDYRSYVQGAWLGVDEAAEKARDVKVAGSPRNEELAASGRLAARAPELAALALDMAGICEHIVTWVDADAPLAIEARALLARLDQLGKEPSDG